MTINRPSEEIQRFVYVGFCLVIHLIIRTWAHSPGSCKTYHSRNLSLAHALKKDLSARLPTDKKMHVVKTTESDGGSKW